MEWFKQEFDKLPFHIHKAFKEQIEELIRNVVRTQGAAIRDRDGKNKPFTDEEISVILHSIFDLASRLRNTRPDE